MGARVFQPSVFQNNVFQVGDVAGVRGDGPLGSTVAFVISDFSYPRKRIAELVAARRAAKEAAERGLRLKKKKQRDALLRAAEEAEQAIAAAEASIADQKAELADIERLTQALQGAASAVQISTALSDARMAIEFAYAIKRQAEDDERDEDEAMTLLLMH